MATFHDRTAAPVCQRGLLRATGPCAVLTSEEVIALTADRPARARDARGRFLKHVEGVSSNLRDGPELPLEPLLAGSRFPKYGEPSSARVHAPDLGGGFPDEPDTAAEARRLHEQRQLYQAFDHGFAMLDAIGLGSLALDVIDDAIVLMDAIDGDADFEPWLAGGTHDPIGITGAALDAEDDSEENEGTALESFGRGFVRAGPDDAEDDDSAEDDDEDDDRAVPWGDPRVYATPSGFHV